MQVDVPGLPLVAAGVVEGDVHVGGALLQLGVTVLVSVQLVKLITIRISCQFPYYLSGLSSPSSSSAPPRLEEGSSSSPLVLNERRFCNNRSLKGPTHFRTRTKQNKCKFSSPPPHLFPSGALSVSQALPLVGDSIQSWPSRSSAEGEMKKL